MHKRILEQLKKIERDHNVTIIFAIESGSRAWGFPSADSDYDVRFVYAHRLDWYLSITPERDVIEIPVDPILDINGWDVRKALQLLRKSNPSLMEWLSSPIQYQCNDELAAIFRSVVPIGFQQQTLARHYLSMAKSTISKTHRDHVRMKSYLYSLRPLLCCKWVLQKNTQPPIIFRDLVDVYLSQTEVGDAIESLIARKETETEADTIPKHAMLDQFIAAEFSELSELVSTQDELPEIAMFNSAFRQIIERV